MSTHRNFEKERELFSKCLERPREEWDQVLEAHCDDPGLRDRVRRLLERHRDTPTSDPGFLRLDGKDPDRIGPYRILQRLGEGGMGIVYAAEQREPMRRRVAIKVLRGGFSSREVLARFDVERQALALMNHANIARILDAGTTADHSPFIVMEFVPGEPITRYCEQRDLPLRQRLELLRTVCDAVQHAHQKGVIHRDLKPSNILVMEEDGKPLPKIIDFGIAKAVSQPLTERTLETRVGSLLGTPDYMSPEQAELSPLDVDTRSDVYALGAVMYRLLAGVTPLQLSGSGKSYTDIQRAIIEELPAPPSRRTNGVLQRQLRGELDWIVLKALEKRRADRYETGSDLAADIRRYLANETVSAGPPSRLRKIDKFVRRHWLATASALAVIATLTVSQMVLIQKNRELEAERDRANVAATTSKNVTGFLLDIFNATNPRAEDAGKITARELLERGRQKISEDASLPREVRLHLVRSLAEAYRNLGLHEEEIELMKQARRLFESGAGSDPFLEFEILSDLGRSEVYARYTEEAREPLEAAVKFADTHPVIPFGDTVATRIALSHMEMEAGNYARALYLAEQLFSETRKRFGDDNMHALKAGAHLAGLHSVMANLEEAERLIGKLLPVARRTTGEKSPTSLHLQFILGMIHSAYERWEDAELALRPMYEMHMQMLGPQSSATQSIAARYAVTLADPRAGIEILERQAALQRKQYDRDTPLLIDTLQGLGVLHLRIPGNELQAQRFLDEARVLAEKLFGAGHQTTRSVYIDLARLNARRGHVEAAMTWLRKVGNVPVLQFQAARSPDFAALRENPEFVALLGRFGDDRPDSR